MKVSITLMKLFRLKINPDTKKIIGYMKSPKFAMSTLMKKNKAPKLLINSQKRRFLIHLFNALMSAKIMTQKLKIICFQTKKFLIKIF